MEYLIFLQQILKKAKATEATYFKNRPLNLYLLRRSYLSYKGFNNKKIRKLKKAISEIVQGIKTFIQKQNKNKKIASSLFNLLEQYLLNHVLLNLIFFATNIKVKIISLENILQK